jgi:hypothetical protein
MVLLGWRSEARSERRGGYLPWRSLCFGGFGVFVAWE